MVPAEIHLLKALFESEKANNPYYHYHVKNSYHPQLRGFYNLSDFLPKLDRELNDMKDLLDDSPYVIWIGSNHICLSPAGYTYCQQEFIAVAVNVNEDKPSPVGFIK
jgi:hypothetical protein